MNRPGRLNTLDSFCLELVHLFSSVYLTCPEVRSCHRESLSEVSSSQRLQLRSRLEFLTIHQRRVKCLSQSHQLASQSLLPQELLTNQPHHFQV